MDEENSPPVTPSKRTESSNRHTGRLIARPGARFRCVGDGLCCTDIHALGPLTPNEANALSSVVPDALSWNDEFSGDCLRVDAKGACQQLDPDGRCSVQRRFGLDKKPVSCRHFPYGLVDTPLGLRVTTEHRCPCRSLGGATRPPIDLTDADTCLRDLDGKLETDVEAPDPVPLSCHERVAFVRYAEIESACLGRLADGERAESVLGVDPLPPLESLDWEECGHEFLRMPDGSAGGVALAWFGEALLELTSGTTPSLEARPWKSAFERGIARSPIQGDPEQIVNDWLADELWMLRWLGWDDCSFAQARAELATRLASARVAMRRLGTLGLRADQAAAEAVMIAGIAGATTRWPEQVADIVEGFG
jgi:hypothetical protein